MQNLSRQYFIDWLRVIAIGFLLIYHVAIGFQPWGLMIGFITNDEPLPGLWIPMAALNVWRIPLLFFVSGMGVYFSMQRRSWKALIGERSLRILVPYIFGMFCIFPISIWILKNHYGWPGDYTPNPGHLWFLGNIFAYVIILSPLFYFLKSDRGSAVASKIRRVMSHPAGLLIVFALFQAEVFLVQPNPYELYAMTWHGFFLGFLAFLTGFLFVMTGESFWKMLLQWRWILFAGAVTLFLVRMLYFKGIAPLPWVAMESPLWILSVFAFGSRYLNRSGSALSYLSEAAYPVYILHMIFLFLGSALLFPLDIPAELKFIGVLVFTFAGCFAAFEIIRRTSVLRVVFGLKIKSAKADREPVRIVA